MTRAAGSGPEDEGRRRPRLAWWAYTLVALVVGGLTVAVVWALDTAVTPVRRPAAEPSVAAIPLPTFVDTTPKAAPGRTAAKTSATASPSPSPTAATPSPDPSASTGDRPEPSPTRSASPGVVELTPLPAEQERDLHSVNGGADTTVEFVNQRDGHVIVYWLNHWGYRVRIERLSPGESHREDTNVGYPFVVTDGSGRALAVFQPVASPARAVIR
ncbi:hypothetical protein GA0074692_4715 [Micromonospora pallida]|uniref:von Hippel-Lindau disease tumour suppressor protein n=1 Tax=Micromonospora pallida TaxID=145854 RepID=A0A1C6T7E6_9ACTN|nr:hypothetical protein [Micromonospora pallida]SCL37577.1 hypothetical protein GA0074692_4715 [Micromonospora pallida]